MLKAIFEPYYIDIFHKFGEVTSKIPAGTILMKDATNAEYVTVSNGTDFWGVLSQDLYPDPGSEYIKPYNDHRAYSGDQVGIYHKGMFETDQFVVSYEVDDQVEAEGSAVVGEVEVSITGEADEAYHNVKVVFEGEGSSDAATWDEGVLTITLQDAETYTKTDIDTLITGAADTAPEGVTTLTVDFEDDLTGEDLAGAKIVLKCVFVEVPYTPGADLYVTSEGKFTNILEEGEAAATETSGKVKVGKIVKKEGNKLTVKLG